MVRDTGIAAAEVMAAMVMERTCAGKRQGDEVGFVSGGSRERKEIFVVGDLSTPEASFKIKKKNQKTRNKKQIATT